MFTVIGVPLLLAYVYGVVPLSLCRSVGSCGIRTSSSGVRINVNEEEDCPTPGTLSMGPFQSASNVGSCPFYWIIYFDSQKSLLHSCDHSLLSPKSVE